MAKQTGLSWETLSIDDSAGAAQDIRNDINQFNFATPRAVLDVTGIDVGSFERLLGLADFTIEVSGTFNSAANKSHAVFSTVPSTSVERTVSLGIGGKTLAVECLFSDYALTRAQSGELTWTAPGSRSSGAGAPTWA